MKNNVVHISNVFVPANDNNNETLETLEIIHYPPRYPSSFTPLYNGLLKLDAGHIYSHTR